MIYELREYVAEPGAADRLRARFAEHTLDLFERHGLTVAAYWHDPADESRVVYVLSFPDEPARQAAWAAFQADPEWKRVKTESEKDGPVVREMHSRLLTTPDYWPHRVVAQP